jgi:hypothetical protein
MRKRFKKPMTPHAEKLVIGKIDKYRGAGHDPTVMLNQSILNGWQDIYEPKENKNARVIQNTTKFDRPNKTERLIAAARRAAESGGFASGFEREITPNDNFNPVLSEPKDVWEGARTIRGDSTNVYDGSV